MSPPASSRTRVLRIVTRLNIGGPAIQALTLSARLGDRGFDTTLVHGQLGPGEGDMRTLLPSPSVTEVFVPSLQRAINPVQDAIAFFKLLGVMRRVRPMIVHTHMAKAGALGRLAAIAYNALAGHGQRARLVHTYHGHVLEGYFSERTTAVFLRMERWLARRTDALIAVSPLIRKALLDDLGIGVAQRFHVIPLGFDLEPFAAITDAFRAEARRQLQLPDAPIVCWVGRLTAIKRPHLFLETARLVAERVPQTMFLVAGDGELRGQVEEGVRALGLGDRVRLLGWRGDLARIYAASDVFVLTSRNEGTPVALIEAMASGIPGVVPDVGGIRDVVPDRSLGVVVEDATVESLAAEICWLLRSPADRRSIGEAAQKSAIQRFGFGRLANDIASLYLQLNQQDPLVHPVAIASDTR